MDRFLKPPPTFQDVVSVDQGDKWIDAGLGTRVIIPAKRGRACQILRISKPTRPATALTYAQRVNLAIDYIVGHFAEPRRLRDLARVAVLSPFHSHRVFQSLVGST